uniref:Uncharacterized protein n=1 Tax=Solanum lycopersicum TaxID=4081 RepID=A0A3Q7JUE3_SOLLC
MISIYKTPISDSIFAYLSPFTDNLMIAYHEISDSEKEWGAFYMTSLMFCFFQANGFPELILGRNDHVGPVLFSLKDGSQTNDSLNVIEDYLRGDENVDNLNRKNLYEIDLEHDPEDNYPSDGYIEDRESSNAYSQE